MWIRDDTSADYKELNNVLVVLIIFVTEIPKIKKKNKLTTIHHMIIGRVISVVVCVSWYALDVMKPVGHFHRNESGGVQVKSEMSARHVFVGPLSPNDNAASAVETVQIIKQF